MPNYYIDVDENGHEVRTVKGRGPTRKGYIKQGNGDYVRDPDWQPPQKSKVSASENKVYIHFKDDGEYLSHKKVTRGRRPLGGVQFSIEHGKVEVIEKDLLPDNAQLDTIPEDEILGSPKTSSEKMVEVERIEESYDLDEVLRSIHGTQKKSGNLLSFMLCDIQPTCPIETLRDMSHVSRIDIDLFEGDIKIWQVEYQEGNPDVIISNAFESNVQTV